MTTTKETCPKCGAKELYVFGNYKAYECDSHLFDSGSFDQSDRCRITELEKENEILQRKLDHETSLVAALQKESLILENENGRLREDYDEAMINAKFVYEGHNEALECIRYIEVQLEVKASALLQKKGEER